MKKVVFMLTLCFFLFFILQDTQALSLEGPSMWIKFDDVESCAKFVQFSRPQYPAEHLQEYLESFCPGEKYELQVRMSVPIDGTDPPSYRFVSTAYNEDDHVRFFAAMEYTQEEISTISMLAERLQFVGDNRYIVKQSDSEYQDLVQQRNRTNSDLCSCSEMEIIQREGKWTAWKNEIRESCSVQSTGIYPQGFWCPNNRASFITFLVTVIVAGGILIFFVRHMRRSSQKILKPA